MLLNSFLILTWFRKITVIIETDREDDSDIAHHGFPSNALKCTHSHWLNWSVQMACFVLTLLDSFSSHCFFCFFFRRGRKRYLFLELVHLCWRSNFWMHRIVVWIVHISALHKCAAADKSFFFLSHTKYYVKKIIASVNIPGAGFSPLLHQYLGEDKLG